MWLIKNEVSVDAALFVLSEILTTGYCDSISVCYFVHLCVLFSSISKCIYNIKRCNDAFSTLHDCLIFLLEMHFLSVV